MFIKKYHATYLTLCTTKNYCFICAMIFSDDLVLCESTREEAEEQFELCRNAIENNGLRVSRKKTEYLPPTSCHDKVKLGGEEIKNVTTFKYPVSMVDDAEVGTTADC